MPTIIGLFGRVCVLVILFQLYDSNAWLFESNLIWVGQYDPQPSYWKINLSNININQYNS